MTQQIPYIPPPLDEYWCVNPTVRRAYRQLAGISLAEARKTVASRKHVINNVVCYECTPSNPYDQANAIILVLPFANSFRADMAFRAWLILNSLRNQKRVVVFPQNVLGKTAYRLSRADRKTVRQGDFSPIAGQQLAALRKLGVKRCSIAGYSLGAALGASLFRTIAAQRDIAVERLGLAEAPNVTERSVSALTKAFSKGGWQALERAIENARIPALDKLRNTRSLRAKVRDRVSFLHFVASSLQHTNRAIMVGCTRNTFAKDLTEGFQILHEEHHPSLLLGSAVKSAVMPPDICRAITEGLKRVCDDVRMVHVKNYGHELGDNIVAHTVLACMALEEHTSGLR